MTFAALKEDQTDPIGATATEDGSSSPNDMTLVTEEDGSIRVDVLGANRADAEEPTGSLDSGTIRFSDSVPQNQFRIGLFGYTNPQETAGSDTHQWTTDATTREYIAFEIKAAGGGASSTVVTRYIHTDHLGGTNVATDDEGDIVELLDYYPYGEARLDEQDGFSEQRTFIGEMYDPATALSYLNARYYDGAKGKFLSQDPIFQLVGDQRFAQKFESNWRFTRKDSNKVLQQYLANPQNLNSYSYALDNPIRYSDPRGEQIVPPDIIEKIYWIGNNIGDIWEVADKWREVAIVLIPSHEISVSKEDDHIITTDRYTWEFGGSISGGTLTIEKQQGDPESKLQRNKKHLLDPSENKSRQGGSAAGIKVNTSSMPSQRGGVSYTANNSSQSLYRELLTAINNKIKALAQARNTSRQSN